MGREIEMTKDKNVNRCEWAGSELAVDYHDKEWGVPQHDDDVLFEHLFLDNMQAGLSWELILRKRENFRAAFDDFDPARIADYSEQKIEELLTDPGIIRNRLKVNSVVTNAGLFLKIQKEFGSFDRYLWNFVDGKPITNSWRTIEEIPSQSPEAERLSKDLKARGLKFVGSTICYAFMQAVGMVNDHTVDCFRYLDITEMA